jgi:hypothetical protein
VKPGISRRISKQKIARPIFVVDKGGGSCKSVISISKKITQSVKDSLTVVLISL